MTSKHPENMFGGSLTGNIIESITFGILTAQTYTYFTNYRHDRKITKFAVVLIYTLQAFQLACFTRAIYHYLIGTYTLDPPRMSAVFQRSIWEFNTLTDVVWATSVTVQSFFVHRIYELSKNKTLSFFIGALVLSHAGFGFAVVIQGNRNLFFDVFVHSGRWLVITWTVLEVATELIITTSMCILLNRRRTGFKRTDTIIHKLVLYCVCSGVATSCVKLTIFCTFAANGFSYLVNILSITFAGYYSMVMLANLHMRSTLALQARATGSQTDIDLYSTCSPSNDTSDSSVLGTISSEEPIIHIPPRTPLYMIQEDEPT